MFITRAGQKRIYTLSDYGVDIAEVNADSVSLYKIWGPWPATAPFPAEAAIADANILACYQPHWGAGTLFARTDVANQANSYLNIHIPGLNDATIGNVPTWAAGTGWTFDGIAQYLRCSVQPPNTGQAWSMFVECSAASNANTYACGVQNSLGRLFALSPRLDAVGNIVLYGHGGFTAVVPKVAVSANIGFSGAQGYRNGTPEGAAIGGADTVPTMGGIAIGARNNRDDLTWLTSLYFAGWVAAFLLCNTTITANQAANVAWSTGKISGRVP